MTNKAAENDMLKVNIKPVKQPFIPVRYDKYFTTIMFFRK